MKQELPKAYDPSQYEDDIYKKWEKSGYFNPDNLDLPKNAKNYSIVMPPPNVTGVLHMGHAAMLALEDILIRCRRMKGERALWVPGVDHAAIATQTKVEKILKGEGTDRHKLGREKFLEKVRQFAQESHDTIVGQIKKMGCSCDWSREAYTLDEVRTKAVRTVFKMMYDDGLIYRGDRVVNWCPRCHSTLADDEVEYKTQKAKLYTFKYGKDFPFAIATTRPETKLGDTAVAVNPKDKRYEKYIGKIYEVDFAGIQLKLKVIADKAVDMNFGAGAVGVTPAHSMADWQMAQNHNLKIVKVIDENGNICSDFNEYANLPTVVARELIVDRLKEQGLLEKEEEIENNLSLCYRCDTPIEPLPSLQWFINVNKKIPKYKKSIKELTVEAVKKGVFGRDKIKIYPERFEKNYFHWMDNLRDWCVSRQIWYGHQIPVWYLNKSKIKNQKSKINNEIYVGIEAPEGEGWAQDEDTLDTWFSSGLWTFSTLANKPEQIKIKNGKIAIENNDFKLYHPTQVLETGYDILFFWVARMIIMTTYAVGDIPFYDVYLHGLIRDEKGKKMSKSLGNVINPLDMIKKYGTDAVRLSLVIGTSPGNDMNLSEEKIAGFRNFTNKLWNISRYVLQSSKFKVQNSKLQLKIPACQSLAPAGRQNLTLADEWILEKLQNLIKDVSEDLDNYRFSQAGEKLRDFTWSDFADWYLEASKFEKGGEKQQVLLYVLENILKFWHPFMPFVTEAIWGEMDKEKLLMVEKWPSPSAILSDSEESQDRRKKQDDNFEIIKNIIIAIRNARAQNRVEPARKIKAVIYGGKNAKLIKSQEHLIKNLRTGIKELEVKAKGEKIKDAIYITADNIEIYLIGAVGGEKEKIRIKKECDNLEKLIVNTEKKLSDKEFVKKAPAQIVRQEKDKLKLWQEELAKLKGQ
jgi:valyl-tRNA synthetase